MGAILGGTMRSPLTGVIFALELTHDVNIMLPLLLAVTIAHAFTVLTLKRSILTEKVARRGYHLSREYSIDPLEIVFASEVVRTAVAALPADAPRHGVARLLASRTAKHEQRLFPVIDGERRLVGVITRGQLRAWMEDGERSKPLGEVIEKAPASGRSSAWARSSAGRCARR